MNLQTTGTQKSIINHIKTVGHPNEQDVVQLVNTVHLRRSPLVKGHYFTRSTHLGQKLIDYTVTDTSSAASRPTLFANCIQFIENNDMQPTFISLGFVLLNWSDSSQAINWRCRPPFQHLRKAFECFLQMHQQTCSKFPDH